MSRSLLSLTLTFAVLAGPAAMAKSPKFTYSYGSSTLTTQADVDNRVILDAAPMLANGVGLSYERTIAHRFTVGPYGSFFKLSPAKEENSRATFTDQVVQYGVRGRWFLMDDADKNGVYMMGGGGFVNVKSQAEFDYGPSGSNTASVPGVIGGVGYQFVGHEFGKSKLAFNLGGIYGTGYEVENTAHGIIGSSATVDTPNVRGSFYVEANVAFLF